MIKTGLSKGCKTRSKQFPSRKRQPPRVIGSLKPRLSAICPARGETMAPAKEPGRRIKPLTRLLAAKVYWA